MDRTIEIMKKVVKTKIPEPKKGNVKLRIFEDYNQEEDAIRLQVKGQALSWEKQLDNFVKEFTKHYNEDKTHRDIILYEYEIKGNMNNVDNELLDIIRDRMYFLGYTVALQIKKDNRGIIYQSY
jgi:hypothetical protein